MRITLEVELHEAEVSQAPQVQRALESFGSDVKTRVVTDKGLLTSQIMEAIATDKYDKVSATLRERLCIPAVAAESVDILCSAALFSIQRAERGALVGPFVAVIKRLPDPQRESVKAEVVERLMTFLANPRRVNSSRLPLMPYAETLAAMAKADLISIRNVTIAVVQLIRQGPTRCAGMTCLGKLVEGSFDQIRQSDVPTLEALRSAMVLAQQDDSFVYDVEYVMEALGWSQTKHALTLRRSGPHHAYPILSLAYCGGGGANYREAVVTSSVDGTIGTWDSMGVLTENIILSRHYACSLDLANRGHTLIVGTVGRHPNTPPAVVLYSEEGTSRESHWEESGAVEPKNARFITAVRSIRNANGLRFCVGVSTQNTNSALLYDRTQLLQEYHDHADMITSMHVPSDRDTTLITGSRDCSVILYDLRSRQHTAALTHHLNTVSAISTCGDYLITGGLDKRIIVEDVRMIGHQTIIRDMDSAVLSLSVNNAMYCAVATQTGIYTINFASGTAAPATSRADCGSAVPRHNAISWNAGGNMLYAGGDGTTLDLFARSFGEGDSFEVA